MLKTKELRKIFITTLSLFMILTIFSISTMNNRNDNTLQTNLEIAGFSIPEIKLQEVKSNYVVQANMVREWFINPPSPTQPSTKERFLKYFDLPTVEKFMIQVEEYLTGRSISLKTNAVFINATK